MITLVYTVNWTGIPNANDHGNVTGDISLDHAGSAGSTTPLPAAVWMMGSVLAGGAGFGAWRKRRKAA